MAYLLAIATTEAMDPTRVSDPFRTATNVVMAFSFRSCGETHGVAEEVGAGQDVDRVSPREADHQTMEPRVLITEKEVHEHGC